MSNPSVRAGAVMGRIYLAMAVAVSVLGLALLVVTAVIDRRLTDPEPEF